MRIGRPATLATNKLLCLACFAFCALPEAVQAKTLEPYVHQPPKSKLRQGFRVQGTPNPKVHAGQQVLKKIEAKRARTSGWLPSSSDLYGYPNLVIEFWARV